MNTLKNKPVCRIAFYDISKYLRGIGGKITGKGNNVDIWVVNPTILNTKEVRRLNKELGIKNINYTKDNINRKRCGNQPS